MEGGGEERSKEQRRDERWPEEVQRQNKMDERAERCQEREERVAERTLERYKCQKRRGG